MAGKTRYFLNRNGRFFARLVVPKDLRPFLENRTELRKALGPDRRSALRDLPGAVAVMQGRIAEADRKKAIAAGEKMPAARYPMTPPEIAEANYRERLSLDEFFRNDPRYARYGYPDEHYVSQLRDAMAGKLSDEELLELVGDRINDFMRRGNIAAQFGSQEWRALAVAVCVSEYEALGRTVERDEGDFSGRPAHPILKNVDLEAQPPKPPVSLKRLFRDYVAAKRQIGKGRDIERRWAKPIDDLVRFVGHDDARKLTKKDLLSWRDELITTLAPKTVSDVNLSCVKSILKWAVENDLLEENVGETVRQEVPRKVKRRESGFNDAEALAVVKLSREHTPTNTGNHQTTELPTTTGAKQWAPILCAFTGARIVEITQLRRSDFRREGEHYVMRLDPDAGAGKTGHYRDVPLHPQLIELGFWDYAMTGPDPLFYVAKQGRPPQRLAEVVAQRVRKWLKDNGVVPDGVQPNHAWRHRFKTVCRELEISDRVADAITGHAARTAGDQYGDVTIETKANAIKKLPAFDLSARK